MSTQTIKDRPLVTEIGGGRSIGWIKDAWAKIVLGRKQLLIGGAAMAAVVLAGLYFWGGGSSTTQYMTAKIERGNLRNTVTATGTLQAVTTVQVGSQA